MSRYNSCNKTMSLNRMENWRLSRIEEELEGLNISGLDLDGYDSKDSSPELEYHIMSNSVDRKAYNHQVDQEIYSKVVILPSYKKMDSQEEQQKEALKKITGKYDSLERVKPKHLHQTYVIKEEIASNNITSLSGNNESLYLPNVTGQMLPKESFTYSENGSISPGPFTIDPRLAATDQALRDHFDQAATDQHLRDHFDQALCLEQEQPLPIFVPSQFEDNQQMAAHTEISDSSRDQVLPDHLDTTVTEQDVMQVEMFYRSHKTEVFVCQSMANLYFGHVSQCSNGGEKWTFVKEGVPVIVLDSGESRRLRKMHLVLAEKGTGFMLWRDTVNHLTNYKAPHANFHTMHLSNDHTKVAGFSFDDTAAATDFLCKVVQLTSDPSDEILNLSKTKKKKKSKGLFRKYKAPSKADISKPCCFTHITKLDHTEGISIVSSPKPVGPPKDINPNHLPVRQISSSSSRSGEYS